MPSPELGSRAARLAADPSGASLRALLEWLLGLDAAEARALVAAAAQAAAAPEALGDPEAARWVLTLAREHPGDAGVLAPLYLELVCIRPGDASFLDAATPHAYLEGTGIELMANSDNVLRGGLTRKHVDVPELLRALRFAPAGHALSEVRRLSPTEARYITPAREFALSVVDVSSEADHSEPHSHGVQILLVTHGSCEISTSGSPLRRQTLRLRRGESCLVPAAAPGYEVRGRCRIHKAGVGGP